MSRKAETAVVARKKPGPKKAHPKLKEYAFKPGQSGNPAGRPTGARHKLSSDYIRTVHEKYTKYGERIIEEIAQNDPVTFIKLVADLVPRDFELNIKGDDVFLELWRTVSSGSMKLPS